MINIALIVLGVLSCLVIIYNIITHYYNITDLKDTIQNKDKEIRKLNQTITDLRNSKPPKKDPFKKGTICLYPKVDLTSDQGGPNEEKLSVSCELEVLEVSDTKVKVKVLDIIALENHLYVNDPANRKGLFGYFDNRWISKIDLQIIKDTKYHRDETITDILEEHE